jgi:hypothetical protein
MQLQGRDAQYPPEQRLERPGGAADKSPMPPPPPHPKDGYDRAAFRPANPPKRGGPGYLLDAGVSDARREGGGRCQGAASPRRRWRWTRAPRARCAPGPAVGGPQGAAGGSGRARLPLFAVLGVFAAAAFAAAKAPMLAHMPTYNTPICCVGRVCCCGRTAEALMLYTAHRLHGGSGRPLQPSPRSGVVGPDPFIDPPGWQVRTAAAAFKSR